ncbi:MAG: endolytic transglycosylase MltG [Paludibacter sp.]|nr:endolytic transglycosylase MltG [Paludibacter sp.]
MAEKSNKKQKNSQIHKPILLIVLLLILFGLYGTYILFIPNISPKENSKTFLCIPDSSSLNDVLSIIQKTAKIGNVSSFRQVATIMRYNKIHPGRYEINGHVNNFSLIRLLRSGRQTPVKLTFNNIRTKEQLAGKLADQLMADSVSIINLMNDSAYLAAYGLDTNTVVALFIPNTYEIFWNVKAPKIFERMKKEYDNFWTPDRVAKADSIPFTPIEVSTLASIVEEETNGKAERRMVAGLYINRLKQDMPLQADPTLKFAVGDFKLKRLGIEQIKKPSPYNTYLNKGLPPGPIRVASPAGIDAVLNYTHHKYIYMCAKETLNGEHNFASSYAEHMRNAKKYQKALNDRKIFK